MDSRRWPVEVVLAMIDPKTSTPDLPRFRLLQLTLRRENQLSLRDHHSTYPLWSGEGELEVVDGNHMSGAVECRQLKLDLEVELRSDR